MHCSRANGVNTGPPEPEGGGGGGREGEESRIPELNLDFSREEGENPGNSDSVSNVYYSYYAYAEDPIATRICELFDEMQDDDDDDDEQQLEEAVIRRRRVSLGVDNSSSSNAAGSKGAGFFTRRRQTVSGYFADWTKWLRQGQQQETTASRSVSVKETGG